MNKTRKLKSVSIAIMLLLSLTLSTVAFAQTPPTAPMTVYGVVYIDTLPAPAGMTVYAKEGTTIIDQCLTLATGQYALEIEGSAEDVSIDIWVEEENLETITFTSMDVLILDLTYTGGAPPEPDTGFLSVNTDPTGGEVFVDDVSKGMAPVLEEVEVGIYAVSFGAVSGYTTPADQVAVVTKDTTTTIIGTYVLIPAGDTGTLSVDTEPFKGYVFVDGASWGVAPKSQVLAVGDYTVSFGPVTGYTTPSPVSATVTTGTVTPVMGTYVWIPVTPTESGFTADNIDVNNKKAGWGASGEKGHTIELIGDSGSVASGYEVLVYLDKIQDWDGEKGFLNTTDADDDGGFEVWFKVPEADVGTHYIWFEATDQEGKVSKSFTVISDCDISTASGLAGSKIYVDLWGFAKNKEVAILFVDSHDTFYSYGTEVLLEDLEETVDTDEDDYDGTLENEMIVPGTFVLHIGTATFKDDYDNGKIYSAADESCGSINYVTGEWAIDLGDTAATETGAFTADYDYFDELPDQLYVIASNGVTDDLGTWEDRRITIPDDADEKQYYIVGLDGKGNFAFDDFKIGATISLSVDEGPVGTKVEVSGEGFPSEVEVTCELWRNGFVEDIHIIGSEDTPGADDDETDDDGEFEFEIIIPGVSKKDDDYEIKVLALGIEAAADFEITGLATVSAEPCFGPQGSGITVSGENFQNIKDKKVNIMLYDGTAFVADIKTSVKVDSDGSFEATCTVPTENDGPYKIKVVSKADDDGDFYISDTVDFRIGTIMVLLSKDESVVGDKIVLTGNGFTDDGEWNATFGDVTIFSEEQASGTGLLRVGSDTPQFFVPQVQPGEYTITLWDVDAELTVETEFTVTEYTVLDFELLEAPNEFNVSIDGWNWPEVDGDINDEDEIEFVLFNETDDWEMNVRQKGTPGTVAVLNATGFLNEAWWVVPDDEVLDMGTYWVNATIETDNDQEYFMQLEFVIGDVHTSISPRKSTFRIGDTVSFNIEHTFGNDWNGDIWGGDLNVFDQDGKLYWDGDPLYPWSKVNTWYEVPQSAQTASDNPMILLDDAPLGTWTYVWRYNAKGKHETIIEGTFNVEASEADILVGQINDINQAIEDLTDDIIGVTDAIAGVQTNVNSAVQAAQAAVEAANKAIDAVNAGTALAGEAAEAADRAAEAAGKAQDAASSLTTLVYGAIGASLVAALAAIVSLMQISRRIAG